MIRSWREKFILATEDDFVRGRGSWWGARAIDSNWEIKPYRRYRKPEGRILAVNYEELKAVLSCKQSSPKDQPFILHAA